jgi:hypothetical protein
MNYGPLEFAAYLRRDDQREESATVKAARAAAPDGPLHNHLTVIAGQRTASAAVTVCEIVAARTAHAPDFFDLLVRRTSEPLVLVLSSHEAVPWRLSLLGGVVLEAVLLSGQGGSTVTGAGDAPVARIGGYYAFRQGTAEFRHLEHQVRMCTGHGIGRFRRFQAANSFDLGEP